MNRLHFLDSLRGIAALAVTLFHFTSAYRHYFGHNFPDTYDFDFGLYGVELFFMISGFVIFFSFEKIESGKDFLFNRVIRLYPAYWFCLVITFVVVRYYGLPELETTIPEMVVNLTMFQKLLNMPDVDGVYWSLFAEWMFYLMMLVIFATNSLGKILYIGSAWILLTLVNAYLYSFGPLGRILNLHYSVFFYAGILFYLYIKSPEKQGIILCHILASCLAAVALYFNKGMLQLTIMVAFFLLFYLGINGKLNFLVNRVFLFFGSISYSLYLFHQNIGYVIMNQTKEYFGGSPLILVPPLFLSVLMAYLITSYIEQPVVRYLKAWYKMRKGKLLSKGSLKIPSGFTNKSLIYLYSYINLDLVVL